MLGSPSQPLMLAEETIVKRPNWNINGRLKIKIKFNLKSTKQIAAEIMLTSYPVHLLHVYYSKAFYLLTLALLAMCVLEETRHLNIFFLRF